MTAHKEQTTNIILPMKTSEETPRHTLCSYSIKCNEKKFYIKLQHKMMIQ